MNTPDSEKTSERKYYGRYRGKVSDNNDPLRLFRVKCIVNEVLGTEFTTTWAATSQAYGGGSEYGDAEGLPVGTGVFVEFESGDVNRPLVVGTWWGNPRGKSPEPPQLTRADGPTCYKNDPSTMSPKGDDSFKTASCKDACQPVSPLIAKGGPKYPFNQVKKTKNNGIVLEIDDTPNLGRVHLWHGPSKSWFEIDRDGEVSVAVNGNVYWLTRANHRLHVKGTHDIAVDGEDTKKVGGDRWLSVGGATKRIMGGEETTWVQGLDQRVSFGGQKNWSFGDRIDVVFGNYKQFIMGKMQTNVFGIYDRLAAGTISDQASAIFHSGGGPSGSPPSPPNPPSCSGSPSCPVPSVDRSCPPLPR